AAPSGLSNVPPSSKPSSVRTVVPVVRSGIRHSLAVEVPTTYFEVRSFRPTDPLQNGPSTLDAKVAAGSSRIAICKLQPPGYIPFRSPGVLAENRCETTRLRPGGQGFKYSRFW